METNMTKDQIREFNGKMEAQVEACVSMFSCEKMLLLKMFAFSQDFECFGKVRGIQETCSTRTPQEEPEENKNKGQKNYCNIM